MDLRHHRNHGRRLTCHSRPSILVKHTLYACEIVGPNEPANVIVATRQGHLRHDAFDAPICCSDHGNVAAAVAGPPDPNTIRVGLCKRLRVCDSVAIVAYLSPRVDLLARLAITISIVEHNRRQRRSCEHLRRGTFLSRQRP
jgi:hypothetical protein